MTRIRELLQLAEKQYAGMDSYIVRLRRKESVNGKEKPEEILLFKFRKQPFSVYFKWLGPEGQGREVVYVHGRHESKIHTLTAAGDMPFLPGGRRIALPPDNVFVRNSSRHSITEAGVGALIEKSAQVLAGVLRNDPRAGSLKYLGPTQRPEYDAPLEGIEHAIPAGIDTSLPRGGRRQIFIDPASHLPVLVIAYDETGRQVEYYCYDRFLYPVHLDDADFDPDQLWGARR